MDLVGNGGEDTLDVIQGTLLNQIGWLLVPHGYGPGEHGILVAIAVSLDVLEHIIMIGTWASMSWCWADLPMYVFLVKFLP